MPWRVSAAGQFTHAEQVLSDGSYLVTLHPVGVPAVQVRIIEYRIEPHTAERLAEFPSSQTSNHPDPRQLHRLVTTLLDPRAWLRPASSSTALMSVGRSKRASMSRKPICV
jgi:hypothetical protein